MFLFDWDKLYSCNEMREINLEIMFKDIFFDYSYYILDKIEKMDMCYIFLIIWGIGLIY